MKTIEQVSQLSLHDFTERISLPDQAIQFDDVPWVPQGEGTGVYIKPVRFDLSTGTWINYMKSTKGGKINRHRHTGGEVLAYTIKGQWRYLEREWVAKAGTFVYEPPGDIHTFVVDGEEEMMGLFFLSGSIQFLDDNDQIIGQRDAFSNLQLYLSYCEKNNIPVKNLVY